MVKSPEEKRMFRVVLIKPSHYDDDGYVIQWLRSALPSNTLAKTDYQQHPAGRSRFCRLCRRTKQSVSAYDGSG